MKLQHTKTASIITLFLNLFFVLIIIWFGISRYNSFLTLHKRLGEASTYAISSSLENEFSRIKKSMTAFAEAHQTLFLKLSTQKYSKQDLDNFNHLLNFYYPEYYAFAIADKLGNLISINDDKKIDINCKHDLKLFSKNGDDYKIYLHANTKSNLKHFNVIIKTQNTNIFLISFTTNRLKEILTSFQPSDHQFFLNLPQENNWPAIRVELGAFDIWQETMHVIAKEKVEGTKWYVYDVVDESLFFSQKIRILFEHGLIIIINIIINIIILFFLQKEEKMSTQTNQFLIEKNEELTAEQEVAKSIYDKITIRHNVALEEFRYHMTPSAIFNGDFLLAARDPNEHLFVMLGDFSGHGLPAAIGVIPVSSTFYAMVEKGRPFKEIISEINSKLHQLLPVNKFCASSILEIDFDAQKVHVWHGGSPPPLVVDTTGIVKKVIRSGNVPLGILNPQDFDLGDIFEIQLSYGDTIYLYSDGLVDVKNDVGDYFTHKKLIQFINKHKDNKTLFDSILQFTQKFNTEILQRDDISLVEISMLPKNQQKFPDKELPKS